MCFKLSPDVLELSLRGLTLLANTPENSFVLPITPASCALSTMSPSLPAGAAGPLSSSSVGFHNFSLTSAYWNSLLRLLEFALIHFAVSTPTSDSIHSSLLSFQLWLRSWPQWLREEVKVCLAVLYTLLSHAFPSVVRGGGGKDGGRLFLPDCPQGACFSPFRRSLHCAACSSWVWYGKVETSTSPQGPIDGSSAASEL